MDLALGHYFDLSASLTLFLPDTHFGDIYKQRRPSSDAAKAASKQGLHYLLTETSKTTNGRIQMTLMDKSTGLKKV